MKRKVHVIPHSHWDREWYFTTSRSKVYLMKNLKDVLDTLQTNDDFKYFMPDLLYSDCYNWCIHYRTLFGNFKDGKRRRFLYCKRLF